MTNWRDLGEVPDSDSDYDFDGFDASQTSVVPPKPPQDEEHDQILDVPASSKNTTRSANQPFPTIVPADSRPVAVDTVWDIPSSPDEHRRIAPAHIQQPKPLQDS